MTCTEFFGSRATQNIDLVARSDRDQQVSLFGSGTFQKGNICSVSLKSKNVAGIGKFKQRSAFGVDYRYVVTFLCKL